MLEAQVATQLPEQVGTATSQLAYFSRSAGQLGLLAPKVGGAAELFSCSTSSASTSRAWVIGGFAMSAPSLDQCCYRLRRQREETVSPLGKDLDGQVTDDFQRGR